MQTTAKNCRVFHATEMHVGEIANWQKSMPVITETVNALRTDGQVQIFQYIVVANEDDEEGEEATLYREIVRDKYKELFEMFAMHGEAFNVTVKSVQDTYCVITIIGRLDSENRISA